jgi:hypothetical protein
MTQTLDLPKPAVANQAPDALNPWNVLLLRVLYPLWLLGIRSELVALAITLFAVLGGGAALAGMVLPI